MLHIVVPLNCSNWVELLKGYKVADEKPERLEDDKGVFYKFRLESMI